MQPDATQAQPEAEKARSIRQNLKKCSEKVVTLNFASWNQLNEWLRQIERLRRAA